MTETPSQPEPRPASPLPAALLTLAVVVMLGGVAQAGQPHAVAYQARRAVIADRDGLGQIVAAFANAARKLGQHRDTQPAIQGPSPVDTPICVAAASHYALDAAGPQPASLRDELTHLPPPAIG